MQTLAVFDRGAYSLAVVHVLFFQLSSAGCFVLLLNPIWDDDGLETSHPGMKNQFLPSTVYSQFNFSMRFKEFSRTLPWNFIWFLSRMWFWKHFMNCKVKLVLSSEIWYMRHGRRLKQWCVFISHKSKSKAILTIKSPTCAEVLFHHSMKLTPPSYCFFKV